MTQTEPTGRKLHYGLITHGHTARPVGHVYGEVDRDAFWFFTISDAQWHFMGETFEEAKERIVEQFGDKKKVAA